MYARRNVGYIIDMNRYKQTHFGKNVVNELFEIYASLTPETKAFIDAKADAVAEEMRKRNQKFGRDAALEVLLTAIAFTEDPTLIL